MEFCNRAHAGRLLAQVLSAHGDFSHALVLALPRGGVPVAWEVARRLGLPLDVYVVRKLGIPGHEEYAFGAIAGGGVSVINEAVVRGLGLDATAVEEVIEAERAELERRERDYRGGQPPHDVRERQVLVVDDGLATGATMLAAVRGLRQLGARAVVAAAPVVSPDAIALLRPEADEVLGVRCPATFFSVGEWYADFSQTTDEEVRRLLAEARHLEPARHAHAVP
ncbi:phosphoribosyltransferase [Variovorax sp. IB41]|uniref:phosphoribosyltransferase n=1 Tax=Variovorax sp. IB41 TaxID=2779370 RepID=UPI0018E75609|nr:phosphoribosyltransferase family protein [Variovorax sp. IB41]MBJ2158507.1 phosphoribosyltransferase [Variovorax sp. IB41]